uniref:Uncharacterized protein n=1 Tax=Arundo donax TaxID=35708 RepID=A0A0A9GZW1_ARUDO
MGSLIWSLTDSHNHYFSFGEKRQHFIFLLWKTTREDMELTKKDGSLLEDYWRSKSLEFWLFRKAQIVEHIYIYWPVSGNHHHKLLGNNSIEMEEKEMASNSANKMLLQKCG